jgi:hypothetical protein
VAYRRTGAEFKLNARGGQELLLSFRLQGVQVVLPCLRRPDLSGLVLLCQDDRESDRDNLLSHSYLQYAAETVSGRVCCYSG